MRITICYAETIQRRSSVRGERIAALGAPTDDPVGGDGAAGWR
jgi:hypothetical protein